MRFQTVAAGETGVVWFFLPTGGTVTVDVRDGADNAVALDSDVATESSAIDGAYFFSLANLTTDPTTFTVLLLVASDAASGARDAVVVAVGGFPDKAHTAADAADAVWDEAVASHVSAGSTGERLERLDLLASGGAGELTPARVVKLDFLDVAISTRAVEANVQGHVQAGLTAQGYTAARATKLDNLDNLDATITSVLAAIAALNNLSIADVQTALTAQGYTSVRAALLDNLDAAVSSRSTLTAGQAADAVWDEAVADHVGAGSTGERVERLDLLASGGAGELTPGRATNLDNLNATVSSRASQASVDAGFTLVLADTLAILAAIAALNDLSEADVQDALTAQGYTAARAVLLDNLSSVPALLAAVEKIRKVTTNKVVVNLTDTQVDVYEDDGSTVAFSFTISADRRTRTPI